MDMEKLKKLLGEIRESIIKSKKNIIRWKN